MLASAAARSVDGSWPVFFFGEWVAKPMPASTTQATTATAPHPPPRRRPPDGDATVPPATESDSGTSGPGSAIRSHRAQRLRINSSRPAQLVQARVGDAEVVGDLVDDRDANAIDDLVLG